MPNPITWWEIGVKDAGKAKEFYGKRWLALFFMQWVRRGVCNPHESHKML